MTSPLEKVNSSRNRKIAELINGILLKDLPFLNDLVDYNSGIITEDQVASTAHALIAGSISAAFNKEHCKKFLIKPLHRIFTSVNSGDSFAKIAADTRYSVEFVTTINGLIDAAKVHASTSGSGSATGSGSTSANALDKKILEVLDARNFNKLDTKEVAKVIEKIVFTNGNKFAVKANSASVIANFTVEEKLLLKNYFNVNFSDDFSTKISEVIDLLDDQQDNSLNGSSIPTGRIDISKEEIIDGLNLRVDESTLIKDVLSNQPLTVEQKLRLMNSFGAYFDDNIVESIIAHIDAEYGSGVGKSLFGSTEVKVEKTEVIDSVFSPEIATLITDVLNGHTLTVEQKIKLKIHLGAQFDYNIGESVAEHINNFYYVGLGDDVCENLTITLTRVEVLDNMGFQSEASYAIESALGNPNFVFNDNQKELIRQHLNAGYNVDFSSELLRYIRSHDGDTDNSLFFGENVSIGKIIVDGPSQQSAPLEPIAELIKKMAVSKAIYEFWQHKVYPPLDENLKHGAQCAEARIMSKKGVPDCASLNGEPLWLKEPELYKNLGIFELLLKMTEDDKAGAFSKKIKWTAKTILSWNDEDLRSNQGVDSSYVDSDESNNRNKYFEELYQNTLQQAKSSCAKSNDAECSSIKTIEDFDFAVKLGVCNLSSDYQSLFDCLTA